MPWAYIKHDNSGPKLTVEGNPRAYVDERTARVIELSIRFVSERVMSKFYVEFVLENQ